MLLIRLRLLWAALAWPTERFFNLIELTYAGEFDEVGTRYEDTGEPGTRSDGMVLVSYLVDEQVFCVHRPFHFVGKKNAAGS